MTVARLMLTDFRSYASSTIGAGPGFVVLTGENGAGKTNILEGVSMLGPGRGLRGAALAEMAREGGGGGFAVAAELAEGSRIGTGTGAADRGVDRERRRRKSRGMALHADRAGARPQPRPRTADL